MCFSIDDLICLNTGLFHSSKKHVHMIKFIIETVPLIRNIRAERLHVAVVNIYRVVVLCNVTTEEIEAHIACGAGFVLHGRINAVTKSRKVICRHSVRRNR